MKNLIILLALAITIASCSTTKSNSTPGVSNTIPPVEHGNHFKVLEYRNFDQIEKEKYIAVGNSVRFDLNSKCFEDKFLASELIQTNDKTKKEVLKDIRTNYSEIILRKYYKRFSKVQGYTSADTNVISLNWKFHRYYGTCDASANLFHEITHKYGYGHDYKATYRRPKSVPYTSGRLINECCKLREGE